MSSTSQPPLVRTASGDVRGIWVQGVAAFRGIPYAAPPVGDRRFAPPQPPEHWDGVRSAERQAAAPPQSVGRGEPSIGPMDVPGYDEDCVTLNVWTPSPSADAKLPVLVWFHGGGLLFGAGSASWYDGSVFARRGDMVVVSVNYRLGALGYLYLPPGLRGDAPVANLGLQDQCLALEWVRDNIARFGGDPASVTVAGQSAGAVSIIGLHALGRAKGLSHRVILQSGGLSMPAKSADAAEEVTRTFMAGVGLALDDVDGLINLPVERIVAGQEQVLMNVALSVGADPRLKPMALVPFRLVVDGHVLEEDPVEAARKGSLNGGQMLLLTTAEEMRFAYAFDEDFWQRNRESLMRDLSVVWGTEGVRLFESYEQANPASTPAEVVCDMITDEGVGDTAEIAELRAAADNPAYYAWFSWRSPAAGGRLGACHTIELPFVFNNFDNWRNAPMVATADPDEVRALGDTVQDAWISFVREGKPGPGWPLYEPPDHAAMELGSRVGVVHDPVGRRRDLVSFLRTDA